jgi:hypothetical protein
MRENSTQNLLIKIEGKLKLAKIVINDSKNYKYISNYYNSGSQPVVRAPRGSAEVSQGVREKKSVMADIEYYSIFF